VGGVLVEMTGRGGVVGGVVSVTSMGGATATKLLPQLGQKDPPGERVPHS